MYHDPTGGVSESADTVSVLPNPDMSTIVVATIGYMFENNMFADVIEDFKKVKSSKLYEFIDRFASIQWGPLMIRVCDIINEYADNKIVREENFEFLRRS
eukprot:1912073-Karenia_brevis.AAC.1